MKLTIHEFKGPGIIQGIHNTDNSIRSLQRHVKTELNQNLELDLIKKTKKIARDRSPELSDTGGLIFRSWNWIPEEVERMS
jgi:hypothetical protein